MELEPFPNLIWFILLTLSIRGQIVEVPERATKPALCFWVHFQNSHLCPFLSQTSKHITEEASASSTFFDELIPQNMAPWEIPITEGTLILSERNALCGNRWAQSSWT